MGTWALELMRDEGGPAIFWNAWSGSVGWVVFDSVYDCFSWLAWQVDPDRLGDPAHWGETYRRLERFHERLEDAEPPDDTAEALAVVRRHLRRVEALFRGSPQACSHRLLTFEELTTDEDWCADFREHLEAEGRAPCAPRDDLAAFEALLAGRLGEAGYWCP